MSADEQVGPNGLYPSADPTLHEYRAADADRPEDGCASCGYLAAAHPNKRSAAEPAPPTQPEVAQAADGTGLSDRALAATCNAAVTVLTGHTLSCWCLRCDELRAYGLVSEVERLVKDATGGQA